jgi:hypothetical protein
MRSGAFLSGSVCCPARVNRKTIRRTGMSRLVPVAVKAENAF